jgi:hypothetical protein
MIEPAQSTVTVRENVAIHNLQSESAIASILLTRSRLYDLRSSPTRFKPDVRLKPDATEDDKIKPATVR